MKIYNVNLISKNNYLDKNKKIENSTINKTISPISPILCDTISFGKQSSNKIPLINNDSNLIYHHVYSELKNIPNLPCVYCGEPMLSIPNRKRLIKELSTRSGEELIDTINKNKNFFRNHKANIADNIIKIAKQYPDDNIQEIFIKLAPQYRSKLENEQMEVIRRINILYGNSFDTKEETKLFQSLLYETTQWINSAEESTPFKRKAFLNELKRILHLPIFKRNNQLIKKILTEAEKLPQSIESENAFVVKYARRSSREISELMIYEPMSTIEHIKPQQNGGLTIPENLSVACAQCNNLVRNNRPMDKFTDEHPEIHKNLRKNFDAILAYSSKQSKQLYKKLSEKNINNENYQRYLQDLNSNAAFKNYISAIAKTYMKESKGKLDLNKYIQENN